MYLLFNITILYNLNTEFKSHEKQCAKSIIKILYYQAQMKTIANS